MNRFQTIRHEFVEFIPEELDEGVLYISIPYATTQHKCACGCGSRVVLPLHPTHWKLTFDGETVSLSPSVGNWSFPCQSHYWIEHDRIRWAPKWSRQRIEAGRTKDRLQRERRVAGLPMEEPESVLEEAPAAESILRRLRRRLGLKT